MGDEAREDRGRGKGWGDGLRNKQVMKGKGWREEGREEERREGGWKRTYGSRKGGGERTHRRAAIQIHPHEVIQSYLHEVIQAYPYEVTHKQVIQAYPQTGYPNISIKRLPKLIHKQASQAYPH